MEHSWYIVYTKLFWEWECMHPLQIDCKTFQKWGQFPASWQLFILSIWKSLQCKKLLHSQCCRPRVTAWTRPGPRPCTWRPGRATGSWCGCCWRPGPASPTWTSPTATRRPRCTAPRRWPIRTRPLITWSQCSPLIGCSVRAPGGGAAAAGGRGGPQHQEQPRGDGNQSEHRI